MQKLDLRKDLKAYYNPSPKRPEVIKIPLFQFIMIDGAIEPGHGPSTSPGFAEAMQGLYGIAYTLKFISKLRKEDPIDYPIMALEGLWWVNDGHFDISKPDNWQYTLMILQPAHITQEMFTQGLGQLRKKRGDLPTFSRLRLEAFEEGLAVQIMHIGPYSSEPGTVEMMRAFASENGYLMRNKHHEIYLGDPRRSDPGKLKTILRHPVEQ